MKEYEINKFRDKLKKAPLVEIIGWAYDTFGVDRVALASSLSIEDQLLTELMLKLNKKARIFTIDTGRLPSETYKLMDKTMDAYNFRYEVLVPNQDELREMLEDNNFNLFYESVEKRKLCCRVRKVGPLNRKLSDLDAWITGLRRSQSITRRELNLIELDSTAVKINPLFDWSEKEVFNFIKKREIPYSSLYDEGYRSIGCAPCTRAIPSGGSLRDGRWWWENEATKECGLHIK